MFFLFEWIIFYVAVMFAMITDNLFWISSSPEYSQVKNYNLPTLFNYIWNNRIKSVLTNWRDICPAIITSFILTLLFNFN